MRISFLFENLNQKQTIAKNFFWLSFGQVIGRLLKAFLVIYAARILGATEYGRFALGLSIISLIFTFSNLGIGPLVTREIAKEREEKDKFLSTSFYLKILLTGISIFIALIISPFIPSKNLTKIVLILLVMATFESLTSFFYSIARGLEKMEREAFIYLSGILSVVILGFIVLIKFPSAFNFSLAYAFGAIFAFLVALILFSHLIKKLFTNFDSHLFKPIFQDAWPLALITLISSIIGYTDTTMLGAILKNSKSVGLYAAPLKIVNLLFVPVGLISSSIFPLLARKVQEKSELNVIRKTIHLAFLVSLPLFFGGFILSKPLILFVFGSQYQESTKIFSLLIFRILVVYPTTIFGYLLFAHNLQKKAAIFSGSTACLNIILNYILIIKSGIIGAAIATVISQFFNFTLYLSYSKKLEKAWPITFGQLKDPLLASLVMSLFLILSLFQKIPVLITVFIGGAIYFFALLILKEPVLYEIKSIIRK